MVMMSSDAERFQQASARADRIVQAWLWTVAVLVLAMIVVGGATRLTDSGLSITEWQPILGVIPPLSEADWLIALEKYRQIPQYQQVNKGMSLEAFQYIYWWEWAHRFLGRIVGVVFAIPLLIFSVRGMLRPRVLPKYLGVLALGGLQGVIGWYMVASGLVDRIDVSHYRLALHLTVAFLILALLVWLAMDLRERSGVTTALPLPRHAALGAVSIVGLIFFQTVLGAFVAGLNAGLHFNTWPLMNGAFIPEGLISMEPLIENFTENPTMVQFNHRIVAYVVVGLGLWHGLAMLRSQGSNELGCSGMLLSAALLAQLALGIVTLLLAVPIGLGVAHQGFAAILLAIAVRHLWLVRQSVVFVRPAPASA